jgi:hypothetical protein
VLKLPCTVYNFHTSLVVVPNLAFAWYPSKPQNNWAFSKEQVSIYRNLGMPTIRGRKPVNSMNEEIGENLITCKNAQAFCMVQLPFPLCKICYIHYHNLHKFCGDCFSGQYGLLVLLGSDSTLPKGAPSTKEFGKPVKVSLNTIMWSWVLPHPVPVYNWCCPPWSHYKWN